MLKIICARTDLTFRSYSSGDFLHSSLTCPFCHFMTGRYSANKVVKRPTYHHKLTLRVLIQSTSAIAAGNKKRRPRQPETVKEYTYPGWSMLLAFTKNVPSKMN